MSYIAKMTRKMLRLFKTQPAHEVVESLPSPALPTPDVAMSDMRIQDVATPNIQLPEVSVAIKVDQVRTDALPLLVLAAPQFELPKLIEEPDFKKGKQVQTYFNESENLMEITIEYTPDLYLLKPGEEMRIYFEPDTDGSGLYTMFHEDGSLQIFLEHYKTKVVTINGRVVEPWDQYESKKFA